MDARHLDYHQRHQLLASIEAQIGYHERLLERMKSVGWDQACPLYVNAVAARDALAAMRDELRLCESNTLGDLWEVVKGIGSLRR